MVDEFVFDGTNPHKSIAIITNREKKQDVRGEKKKVKSDWAVKCDDFSFQNSVCSERRFDKQKR